MSHKNARLALSTMNCMQERSLIAKYVLLDSNAGIKQRIKDQYAVKDTFALLVLPLVNGHAPQAPSAATEQV